MHPDENLRRRYGKIYIIFIVSIIYMLVMTGALQAATYYVDAASKFGPGEGSAAKPWKSIASANAFLRAGDTVVIRKGTYHASINPSASGEDDDRRITFKSYGSERVLVCGPGGESPVVITGNYITIDGLEIKMHQPPRGNTANIDIYGNYNEILNTRIINPDDKIAQRSDGIKEMGIRIQGGSFNKIVRCSIHHLSFNGIKLNTANHTTIRDNDLVDNYSNSISITTTDRSYSGILIENNRLGGSLVSDGIQFNGDYGAPDYGTDFANRGAVIRGNVIKGNAENGIDLKGTAHILVENNIIYGSTGNNDGEFDDRSDRYGGVGGIMRGGNSQSRDIIIRGNVVYDNMSGVQLFDGWKVYNNTIIGNNRDFTGPDSSYSANAKPSFTGIFISGTTKGAAVKNNIIAGHNTAQMSVQPHYLQSIDIDYNLYYNEGAVELIHYIQKSDWEKLSFDQWKTKLAEFPKIKGGDRNSLVADPLFRSSGVSIKPVGDHTNKNFFQLRTASSKAIDAGGGLTKTRHSGSGKKVNLADAGYFYDGFGVTQGDIVIIGGNNAVEISSVDYRQNIITVNRDITWESGDEVFLTYFGNAPDIGAIEHGAPDRRPSTPTNLTVDEKGKF